MCKLSPLPVAAAVVAATLTLVGCAGGNVKLDLVTACKLYKLQELPAKVIAGLVPVPGVDAGVTTAQAIADAACAKVASK